LTAKVGQTCARNINAWWQRFVKSSCTASVQIFFLIVEFMASILEMKLS